MSTHTPGPYRLLRRSDKSIDFTHDKKMVIVDVRSFFIASVHADADERESVEREEQIANAHLIAAAPQLLEALKLANELLDNSDVRHYIGHDLGEMSQLHKALNTARAALAAAQGKD